MMTEVAASNVVSFCLGAPIWAVICQQLFYRVDRKHYAELETLRGKLEAEKDAVQGRQRLLPSSESA